MIINEEFLSEKFRPLARKISCYFEELNVGTVKAEARRQLKMGVSYVEYETEKFRFVFYYSPEDDEREEQIHVTNIIFDIEMRGKGYFSGLMDIL